MDLATDSYQAYVYYINDHKYWSYTTISIVFVPILTRCMSEIIRNLIKKRENWSLLESIKKIAGNLPIFQQIIYCWYLKHLKVAKDQKLKSLEFYKSFDPKTVSEKDLEAYQEDVSKAADDFVKADNDYLKLMTEFQQIKLFDTFGESAPQAALQISIVLQAGNLSAIQVITIGTSFLSLALGASGIFLQLATKDKQVREASWKTKWFLILPSMFMVVLPRILTISLIISYMKDHFFVWSSLYFILNLAINFCFFKRDPSEVTVGILTNFFASCIVIQEGSGFYRRSSISSSLLHITGLIGLCFTVFSGFNLCPDSIINRNAPILHCFEGKFSTNFTIMRCEWTTDLNLTCTDAMKDFTPKDYDSLNCSSLLTIGQSNSNGRSITFCKSIPWWLPLVTVCGFLAILHSLSILLICRVLTKMMNSIQIFRTSKCCFPLNLLDPIVNQNEKYCMDEILKFLERPCLDHAQKLDQNLRNSTGYGLIEFAIKSDYYEIMNIVLEDFFEPVSSRMLMTAIKLGSPKMLKFILRIKKENIKGKVAKNL